MQNLESALSAWRDILGAEHVITDEAALQVAETATFPTTSRVPAIIRPGNRAEVQACVRIANEYKVPIYPISKGKNWGYGSAVPVSDGCAIMALERLNRIVEFDEELAYVTIEPGVTQAQLFEFLRSKDSNLFASMTSSSPDSSLIGNTIERGLASGPYGDRFAHVCGLEVVLPTGECIHTGFDRFANAKSAPVNRWGVGPYVDGIFTQSNLGIVTQMTMWLNPYPEYLQLILFSVDEDKLEETIDSLRMLRLAGVINASLTLVNDYKAFMSLIPQYPWQEVDNQTPLPTDYFETWKKTYGVSKWFATIDLFSASKEQGHAQRKLIHQTLKPHVNYMLFVDRHSTLQLGPFTAWNHEKEYVGIPWERGVAPTYWRKKMPIPDTLDPDRDRCGVVWCAPSTPFRGKEVNKMLQIVEDSFKNYEFEPYLTLIANTERNINLIMAIFYDRDVPGEDERALAWHDEIFHKLTEGGYFPYRLGIREMNALPPVKDDYGEFISRLKKALDPNNILAPGRYDFRTEWPENP